MVGSSKSSCGGCVGRAGVEPHRISTCGLARSSDSAWSTASAAAARVTESEKRANDRSRAWLTDRVSALGWAVGEWWAHPLVFQCDLVHRQPLGAPSIPATGEQPNKTKRSRARDQRQAGSCGTYNRYRDVGVMEGAEVRREGGIGDALARAGRTSRRPSTWQCGVRRRCSRRGWRRR